MSQRHHLLASAALVIVASAQPALAQDVPDETQASATGEAIPQEQIIVTGTRRTDRTVADSPVPIDVIGGEQLADQGYTDTNRILNQLVPSFNFPQPSITDGTDALRPATLRGLSPDQTLVLVNGKRRHPSALLNLNGSVGRGSAIRMVPVPGKAFFGTGMLIRRPEGLSLDDGTAVWILKTDETPVIGTTADVEGISGNGRVEVTGIWPRPADPSSAAARLRPLL